MATRKALVLVDGRFQELDIAVDTLEGGLTASNVVDIAEGLDIIASDAATAAAGNPGATTAFVSFPPRPEFSPNVYLVSLADNNNIFINDVYVGGFNRGDVYTYDGSQGDKVTSDKGVSGVYSIEGGAERPVELASAANAGRQFFWFAFRSTPHRHVVQALALESRVLVYGPNPNVNADGTSPDIAIQDVTLAPFGVLDFTTPTNGEYYILATQPVVVTTTNQNGNRDQRVLAPLTNELFGYVAGDGSGDARISALFANTTVTVYTATGTVASGTASPGSPLSLHGNDGSPINLPRVTNYQEGGSLIVRADGPIAGFAGADAAGTNATTYQPLGSASQVVALPLRIDDANSSNDGVSFCSQYEGTVQIFQDDGTLLATRSLIRRGTLNSPATTQADQLHPADASYGSNDGDFNAAVNRGALLISNVPINVVANLNESNGSAADDDETALFGISPETIKGEFREDPNGLIRRRDIDGSGVETWTVA